MSTPRTTQDETGPRDVMVPEEQAHPDHREHAKSPRPVDDDELAARTEHERRQVDAER
jgi:hypothetical protein